MCLDDGLGGLAFFLGLGQRLFAEDMLAGIHGDLDHLDMGGGIGDDGDCLHVRVGTELLRIRINSIDAELLCHLLCAGFVAVTYGDQLCAGDAVCQVACMLIAESADADDTKFNFFHDELLS